MPFKSFSAPRKVHDIGAEVVAAAALQSPALVAMLARDPAILAVLPAREGTGKTTALSLGSVDGVALLSRDVALVRSGDDVWALVGITHGPRLDQVARDARALVARPTGESALVLGWDGSATALTLNEHEVDARTFALRGEVRACDLSDDETFVVVAVGSGELRVHPGATPEPGATLRVPLPAAAAALERARGGRDLCAVYGAGRREVVLLQRTGGRGTIKLVHLDAAPTCVEVVETSLVAAFADGRLALYDKPTLDAASEGDELAPLILSRLEVRGEPRVLIRAGKTAASLWIGTSSGEVLEARLVRKSG